MVQQVVTGIGVHQHREAAPVFHQPGQHRGQIVCAQDRLEHRRGVGADRLPVQAADWQLETSRQLRAQLGGLVYLVVVRT